jgi:hypothetical protein
MTISIAILTVWFAAAAIACLAPAFRIWQRRPRFWRHLPAA